MCDCYVCLGSSRCFTEPCTKLAGMLLRHTSMRNAVAEGCSFAMLLAAEERERFSEHIEQTLRLLAQQTGLVLSSTDNDCPNPILQTTHRDLVDSLGNRVAFEVFTSCIRDGEGSCSYLL